MNNQNKAEMTTGKLVLMFSLLFGIWILCYKAEKQLPDRFQSDFQERIGTQSIKPQTVALARLIKDGQGLQKNKQTYSEELNKKYGSVSDKQLEVCVVVIDQSSDSKSDEQILTMKSIITQRYQNYHIVYLSTPKDPSLQKIETYLIVNQIPDTRYTIVDSFTGKISDIQKASSKCAQNSLVILLNLGQILITDYVFHIFNKKFSGQPTIWMAWANSLYSNNKLGFSLAYPDKIVQANSYRQYPFLANEVVVFYKKLLSKITKQMISQKSGSQYSYSTKIAYVLPMLEMSHQKVGFLPQILTIRLIQQKQTRNQKSQAVVLQRQIQESKPSVQALNNLF